MRKCAGAESKKYQCRFVHLLPGKCCFTATKFQLNTLTTSQEAAIIMLG